jgi:hypothetical protein
MIKRQADIKLTTSQINMIKSFHHKSGKMILLAHYAMPKNNDVESNEFEAFAGKAANAFKGHMS